MKQEPVMKMKLPKYAAALTVLTVSAGMLTACGGPVQIEGTAPDPSVTTAYTEPDIGGEVALEPEPETPAVIEVLTAAETKITSAEEGRRTYEPELQVMGLVPQICPDSELHFDTSAGEETVQ